MVRKQIYISAEQQQRLRRAATQHRRSEAELIREALDRHLGSGRGDESAIIAKDPLWDIVGIGASGDGDLSTQVDRHLYGRRKR